MCGIVGYTGEGEALPVLLEGMKRLEYRGYDSAGVAVLSDDGMAVARKAGGLEVLVGALAGSSLRGGTGIGHTRWATHGAPTDANAHPHVDGCCGRGTPLPPTRTLRWLLIYSRRSWSDVPVPSRARSWRW